MALGSSARQTSAPAAKTADPAQLFQHGQAALNQGHLDEAERDFRGVLSVDPQAGGAYANLGVIYMRRKQWVQALKYLNKAQQLMPQVAGIRLNIGLATVKTHLLHIFAKLGVHNRATLVRRAMTDPGAL